MTTPTQTDLYITFTRKFIRDFARPSVIIELIETIDEIEDGETDTPKTLVTRLRQMLVTELSYHNRESKYQEKE